jgi:glucose-6-phosphate-specific signal transduction histidine kinase
MFLLYLRLVLLVCVTESIPGYFISQLQGRAKELENHQEALVEAEEKFRREVADHLHDNLQTRLVAVGIQLNQMKNSLEESQVQKIHAIVDEIEYIRSHDVRDFSRGISPEIERDGIEASLHRLFGRHLNVIACEIEGIEVVESFNSVEQQMNFGLYRIIEQAFMNSLIHGNASIFRVRVDADEDVIRVVISNDGKTFDVHSVKQGHGFAVIDAWMSMLGGSWSMENVRDQFSLNLEIPIPISHM